LLGEYKLNSNSVFIEEAEKKLEIAVKENPYNLLALTYLGKVHTILGKKKKLCGSLTWL
jgi:hypothetical protein